MKFIFHISKHPVVSMPTANIYHVFCCSATQGGERSRRRHRARRHRCRDHMHDDGHASPDVDLVPGRHCHRDRQDVPTGHDRRLIDVADQGGAAGPFRHVYPEAGEPSRGRQLHRQRHCHWYGIRHIRNFSSAY